MFIPTSNMIKGENPTAAHIKKNIPFIDNSAKNKGSEEIFIAIELASQFKQKNEYTNKK
jgi:hypothetical protein